MNSDVYLINCFAVSVKGAMAIVLQLVTKIGAQLLF